MISLRIIDADSDDENTATLVGSGGNPTCQNVSVNGTWEMQTVTPDPRFSAETFFDFLAGMMAVR